MSATMDHVERTSKLPIMRKGLLICRVTLLAGAGKILQTGADSDHFSWWRSAEFDPFGNCEVIA
jgi:hypothetical protein